MEIFTLKPALKDYLWGGTRLLKKDESGQLEICAESWEVSAHPDGPSTLLDGPYQGQSLAAYVQDHPEVLGTHNQNGFPILVKFIDAAKPLSIQVHPDDDYGQRVEHEQGKTEMWIILEAQPGAFLYYGVNKALSRDQFRQAIDDGTILDDLNQVAIKTGDIIYVPAGTIHAIGAGTFLCEVQESSNSTYRVYDYKRTDAQGKLRPLHIDKAVDVATLTPPTLDFSAQGPHEEHPTYTRTLLKSSPYFKVTSVSAHSHAPLSVSSASFKTLLILSGSGTVSDGQEKKQLLAGGAYFLPAVSQQLSIEGTLTYLEISVE